MLDVDVSTGAQRTERAPQICPELLFAGVNEVRRNHVSQIAHDAGFNELQFPAAELLRIGRSNLKLVPQVLPEECRALFAEWKNNPNRIVY